MPSASSRSARSGSALRELSPIRLGALALLALLGVAAALFTAGGTRDAEQPAPAIPHGAARIAETTLTAAGHRRLAAAAWQGGSYTAATGEVVHVFVSEAYPDAYAVGQHWADFFASLLHGGELGLVTIYVLTPQEMATMCGARALGCYGGGELAFMGETVDGVSPEEVARHEYGHHVAANRSNAPWLAVDWGTKRWATAANVCTRVQLGSAFPGNEDKYYTQNPGEAFAEVYRVLNESKAGISPSSWPIVDRTFYPDAAALQAVELDVTTPWATTATDTLRGRFTADGKAAWTARVSTPLDGSLEVAVTMPSVAPYDVTVLSSDGRTVLGRGLWSGLAEKRLGATVCGQRSVLVRVKRRGPAGRFTVRVTHP